jgi:signal transduction histidine kinase
MWRDWSLVAVLGVLTVVEMFVRDAIPYRWLSLLAAAVGIPALLIRRTHPLAAVAITFGIATLVDIPWLIDGRAGEAPGLYVSGSVLLLPYALFRWGSGRHALIGLMVMSVPIVVHSVFDFNAASETVTGLVIFLATIVLGLAMRFRGGARSAKLDELRAREREHLARDLHDTVAHHVSAIAIRAQAGIAVAPNDPNAALDALRVIETEASRTLAEMRTIVRTLRGDEAPELAPLPTLTDLPALAAATPEGPTVHVALHGTTDEVPSAVGTAAYRLAQESITNARRHAHAASRIDVVVHSTPDAVTVEVTDDGSTSTKRHGQGYGIIGMIERAEQLGGTCTAGPRDGRGWMVSAVLPIRGTLS